jgi:hypothetical protein
MGAAVGPQVGFDVGRRVFQPIWRFRRAGFTGRVTIAITTLAWSGFARAQAAPQVTGVRVEHAFDLPGANASGVVVSVTIDTLKDHATTDDFVLVLLNGDGRSTGSVACLAMRVLDSAAPNPRWILLDDPAGTLARAHRRMVEAATAVVAPTRKKALERPGRYEFVYWVGSTFTRGALAYGDDLVHHPLDVERGRIGTFEVPRP